MIWSMRTVALRHGARTTSAGAEAGGTAPGEAGPGSTSGKLRNRRIESERGLGVTDAVLLAMLALSAAALALAPLAVADDYSWLAHTTSESAGQGTSGAWLARSGFVLFGLAVGAIAYRRRASWGAAATAAQTAFAILLLMAADFSSRTWDPAASFDQTEDALHSVAATAMGFAFVIAVLLVLARRTRLDWRRSLDLVAIAAATLLPLAMLAWPDVDGLVQRGMFAIAYIWYGTAIRPESD